MTISTPKGEREIPEKPEIFNGDLANLPAAYEPLKLLRQLGGLEVGLEPGAVDKWIKLPFQPGRQLRQASPTLQDLEHSTTRSEAVSTASASS